MTPYATAFDASNLVEPYRGVLSRTVVPDLLRWLGNKGFGVKVSHDLHTKMEYNKIHKDDPKLTYLPIFDPGYWPNHSKQDAVCVYLTLTSGEPMGSIVARKFWVEHSLGQSLLDLSLLYPDPKAMAEEMVVVKALPAYELVRSMHVVVMTGGHIHKDYRKTGAYDALQRLARAKILAEWQWSYIAALIEPDKSSKLGFARYGHELGAPGIYFVHGHAKHEYDLFLSSRAHLRQLICHRTAGDLSRPLLTLTDEDIAQEIKRNKEVIR